MKKRVCAIFLAIAVVLLLATPAFAAVANPDTIELQTVRVFQNIFETDDTLFVISANVGYGTPPTEDAEDTFQMAIYNTDGTTLIQSRPMYDYQEDVRSIYFDATATTSANVVWESDYVVRVMGNPAFFAMTEDTTMDSQTLSVPYWIEGAETASRELLRLWCIDLAEDLEDYWGITLLVTTPERQVLNSAGRTTFLEAIPGLDAAIPELFQVASGTITVDRETRTIAYETELSVTNQLGTAINTAFTGVGTYLGVSVGMVALMWALLFALVIASIIFLNTGNSTAALILTIPIIILCTAVGAIPMAALFTGGLLLVVYAAYHIWLRGM